VDEAPTDAPVAIAEGVDGFELGVSDCRLGDGREVVEVDELDEVVKEWAHGSSSATGGATSVGRIDWWSGGRNGAACCVFCV
jgi:hypothetical protein